MLRTYCLIVVAGACLAAEPKPYILTPAAPLQPRINGPKVFGVRPGNPLLYTIPATGRRPMRFSAKGLAPGLKLDEATGRITGVVARRGLYRATLRAENAEGAAEREFRIVVGETIALTPPMGYNSWNAWGGEVDAAAIRKTADAFVRFGLVNHGWTYINIDDGWQGSTRGGPHNAIVPNDKFPDMQGLCDYVHSLGLKIGIYSTPYASCYTGHIGGSSDDPAGKWDGDTNILRRKIGKYLFEENDVRQWVDWGIDYLKYDWWAPPDPKYCRRMADALRFCDRDIVLSVASGLSFDWEGVDQHIERLSHLANVWRTVGDIEDNWRSLVASGFSQGRYWPLAGPGHWNDPDMLVVGHVGWGRTQHPTRLTPDEQYTHISLWCLLSAPLLIGANLDYLDDFTLNLLTNDEVLAIDQDPLGEQARQVDKGRLGLLYELWIKQLEDGSKAVGIFNRDKVDGRLRVKWGDLDIEGPQRVRDLWRQKDLGVFDRDFEAAVPMHGVLLLKMTPAE